MDAARRRGGTIVWGVAIAVLAVDRATKIWAEGELLDAPIEVIDGVLRLRFATNTGGAFSLFTSVPWLFAAASLLVGGFVAATAFRRRPALQSVALGLILGGAAGNLFDRATRGPWFSGDVIDFIDVYVWPVFNVADSAVVGGAVLLAFSIMTERPDAAASDGD